MTEHLSTRHDYRREVLFAFALALGCYVAWLLRGVLLMLYVSALLAVVLMPTVNVTAKLGVGRHRLGKGLAVVLLLAVVIAAIIAFVVLTIPPVIHDLHQLRGQAPSMVSAIMNELSRIPLMDRIPGTELGSKLQEIASQMAESILVSAGNWAGSFLSSFSAIILTAYFILGGDNTYKWSLSFLPLEPRGRLDKALRRAGVRMGKWLLGQACVMLIFAVVSTVVYLALNIRYPYALGLLTGALNIIPAIGAAITVVVVLLVAAIDSWGRVLGVSIFFAIYLNIENSYIVPSIMRHRVHLPGLAILVALLMGFSLAGIMGALVSVPTAVLVSELLEEYLVWKDVEAGTTLSNN